ncbi:MAG TPA: lipid ABC transporter permease/ATP-binding protein, partial [Rhodoferax sp.]|nr:lipid ABC transporter permease/ATP-binding protein [Rhodoferax sp.]
MKLSSTQLYLRLLGYVKPYWRIFALSILGMAVTAATEPLLPALLKPMLDGAFIQKDNTVIKFAPLIILLIFLVRGI